MKYRIQTLLLLCGSACVPTTRSSGPSTDAETSAMPRIVITRDTGTSWIATYQLRSPSTALHFERPTGFRAHVFDVVTPGFTFERDGNLEVLRTTGAPVSEIRVRFPEYTAQLTREYEFFRRFTDGSVAMYTGHLVARATAATGTACDTCFIRNFEFVPPPGASVVVNGQRTARRTSWTDVSKRGTYVYFGSVEPVPSADVISIIDPGVPEWLSVRTRDALPRLFALYRERLGVAPPVRPIVLFDYQPTDISGYSSGGGTLPGLIQLGVEGRAWARESTEPALQFMHFLAHESAHVWNGEIAHYEGTADAWMHEGSADGMAERALLALGVIDSARFLSYQTAALNECRRSLVETPLRTSVQRGHPQMAYACGNVIALLTERSLSRSDLFGFWRRLIAHAQRAGGAFEAGDYRTVWREHGATASDVDVLEQFLDGRMTTDALVSALRERAVSIAEPAPPPSYGQNYGRAAFAHLMRADCNGRVSFNSATAGFVVAQGVTCASLIPAATIVRIEGHEAVRTGHLAYDAVKSKCDSQQAVRAEMRRSGDSSLQTLSVACRTALPVRPGYVEIQGW